MKNLETNRLILRGFKESDAPDMFEYAKDERVGPNAGWPVHKTQEETLNILKTFVGDGETYAIVSKDDNKVIGSIGIHNRKPDSSLAHLKQREIGYVLNPNYWGQGIVPEAVAKVLEFGFEELDLDLIWCGYYSFNDKSRRVVEKSGFKYQFTVEKTLPLLENKVVELLLHNMTKEDYMSQRQISVCQEVSG